MPAWRVVLKLLKFYLKTKPILKLETKFVENLIPPPLPPYSLPLLPPALSLFSHLSNLFLILFLSFSFSFLFLFLCFSFLFLCLFFFFFFFFFKYKSTPLICASLNNHLEVAKVLIEAHTNIEAKDTVSEPILYPLSFSHLSNLFLILFLFFFFFYFFFFFFFLPLLSPPSFSCTSLLFFLFLSFFFFFFFF